jgi:hypothetical protein
VLAGEVALPCGAASQPEKPVYWPTFQYEYEQLRLGSRNGVESVALSFQCFVIPGNTVSSCERNAVA